MARDPFAVTWVRPETKTTSISEGEAGYNWIRPVTRRTVIGYIGGEPTHKVPEPDKRERKSGNTAVAVVLGMFILTGLVASVKRVN